MKKTRTEKQEMKEKKILLILLLLNVKFCPGFYVRSVHANQVRTFKLIACYF